LVDLVGPVQVLLDRGGPVHVRVEQVPQARPVAALDRGEHVADGGHLLCHVSSPSRVWK
jgi:hypothetical protein